MDGFTTGAGFSAFSLKGLIVGFIVMAYCIWGFWSLLNHFRLWQDGDIGQDQLQKGFARTFIVVLMIITFIAIA